ncbi:MAG: dienelactone hydrolase family protein [Prolixibacteraceae bacterium]|nr:dienelactone hydrolase family protein [Prolixibacteraceae bacterium]
MKYLLLITFIYLLFPCQQSFSQETFSSFGNGKVPQTLEELWKDYAPRKEPLNTEILKEWEEDGVVMKVLRYRIGIFKGQKAMMAAIYGYPKGATNLPGLVQIHGGGQYADYQAVLTNAKRGYATISIAWAGRINAPGYVVNHEIVKLFWYGATHDLAYKVTTDWGALDGYHAPSKYPENSFVEIPTASWTLDSKESPRNNSWFLCTVGARRALTFLEKQPEVNPEKLGVYGHSMGGKLTVLTTGSDTRVKASAPSCGGVSDRYNNNLLFTATLGDDLYLKNINCPIIFLNPSNDFHGRINDLKQALTEIQSKNWRITCSAHHNHQDNAECEVATQLWFDQYLKGTFTFPETPQSSLELKTKNGVPTFLVTPDASRKILSVDVYYTQQGQMDGKADNRENTINRFWFNAQTTKKGKSWIAQVPVFSIDKPLWVYANVVYSLDQPITGAGYYYRIYSADKFNLSSTMTMAGPEQLKAAGVNATMKPSLTIETFKGDWGKEWFTYKPEDWARKTHKLYDDKWKAPENAKLAFEVLSAKPNKLVVGIDAYASEVLLKGSKEWQRVVLSKKDFQNAKGESLPGWNGIMELRLGMQETLNEKIDSENKKLELGAKWIGEKPEFRNLKWID